MTWRREGMEERTIERLLARMWRGIPAPTEDELHAVGRAARQDAEAGHPVPAGGGPRTRRLRLRWALLAAACVLLVGSALGFGLASFLTPSGSAGVNFVGFGFRPVHGWNVLQTGMLDESRVARAVAANIELGAGDDLGGLPRTTIASLPDRGVLIFATFRPRGDPEVDAGFDARELPLQLEDAERFPPMEGALSDLARYRIRAAVGGYNVDARIYFGRADPSPDALATAQDQLSRLVVASERITIRVQPTVIGPRSGNFRARVSGIAQGARAGEPVTFQGKTCGLDFFRVVGGAVTEADGSWWNYYFPQKLTTLRAVWRDETSAEVTVRVQKPVVLRRRSARKFEVSSWGLWRKRVPIQRFDNRLGSWSTVQSVLIESDGRARFVPKVAKGTLIRAVVPRALAAPCYLPGISNSVRT